MPKAKRRPSARKPSPQTETGFLGKSPLAMVLYGPPGVGKTSVASYFPKPGFIVDPQEEGISDLVEYNQCASPEFVETVKDFETLMDVCSSIASGDYSIQTAVFDSATGFEKLCFHYHCNEHFDGDWSSKGFYSYHQGPKNAAKTDWASFLDALESVRKSGVNVILLAHSQVKPFNNPEGPDYDRHTPYLDKETWAQTHRWAKGILFYNYHVEVDRKSGPRNKAAETEQRFLYTQWSPAFDAKNRFGLQPLIDAGDSPQETYNNFVSAFK